MSRRSTVSSATGGRGRTTGRKQAAATSAATSSVARSSRSVVERGPSVRSRYVVGSAAYKLDPEPPNRHRNHAAASDEPRKARTPKTAVKKQRLLGGAYGGVAAFMVLAGIAAALVVSSKVMIAGTQYKAETARVELQRTKAVRERLAAKYTVMAASPKIQHIATKKLKMVTPTPENLVFLGQEPSAAKLEKALKRLDKRGWKIKRYKRWVAAEKKAKAKAAKQALMMASMPRPEKVDTIGATAAAPAQATQASGSGSATEVDIEEAAAVSSAASVTTGTSSSPQSASTSSSH